MQKVEMPDCTHKVETRVHVRRLNMYVPKLRYLYDHQNRKIVRNIEMDLFTKAYLKQSTQCNTFNNIHLIKFEDTFKIENLQSMKIETEHGNKTYSPTLIFFVYIPS